MLFKRKSKAIELQRLEGVITFFGAHHALKGEAVLKRKNIPCSLIPGPREISPNCGTALRFDMQFFSVIADTLTQNSVQFEAIHHYPVQGSKKHE